MAPTTDEHLPPTPAGRRPSTATMVHLRRARALIDRGFDQPLDLDALAAEAGFSR